MGRGNFEGEGWPIIQGRSAVSCATAPIPKSGVGAVPLSVGLAGYPSNTVWPGTRPTGVPSDILIHLTVWPQYTNVTNRQDMADNGPIP